MATHPWSDPQYESLEILEFFPKKLLKHALFSTYKLQQYRGDTQLFCSCAISSGDFSSMLNEGWFDTSSRKKLRGKIKERKSRSMIKGVRASRRQTQSWDELLASWLPPLCLKMIPKCPYFLSSNYKMLLIFKFTFFI